MINMPLTLKIFTYMETALGLILEVITICLRSVWLQIIQGILCWIDLENCTLYGNFYVEVSTLHLWLKLTGYTVCCPNSKFAMLHSFMVKVGQGSYFDW